MFPPLPHRTQVGPNTPLSEISSVLDEKALKRRVVGEDEASWQGMAMQESFAQLHEQYVMAMQRATTDYQMEDAAFRRTVAPLRLPPLAVKTVHASGTVEIPEPALSYADARSEVGSLAHLALRAPTES